MPTWGNYSYAFGPLVALLVVAGFMLVSRWTFSRSRSLVSRPARRGAPGEYGLLETVAAPGSFVEAEMIRRRLVDHDIRATLAPTTEGPRVLVFPEDAAVARALLQER